MVMLKKIIAIIVLFLFTASTSGIVVFAFECSELGHLHYSIFHKVTCEDVKNQIDEHKNIDECCHCENKEDGTHRIKVLKLGIDLDIAKKYTEKINIQKHFVPNCFFTNNKPMDYAPLLVCFIQKTIRVTNFSARIVEHIRTITSKTSEEPHLFY